MSTATAIHQSTIPRVTKSTVVNMIDSDPDRVTQYITNRRQIGWLFCAHKRAPTHLGVEAAVRFAGRRLDLSRGEEPRLVLINDCRLVVQDDIQEGTVNLQRTVICNESQFSKAIHEKTDA